MSPVADPQPELPPEEELVAYLDGELPPDECRRLEARLAEDASVRRRLHDLDQAWEALDVLPMPRADDEFARTTMELVTVAAENDLSQQTARTTSAVRRRTWWLAGAAVAAALIGFATVRALQNRSDEALLTDLPAIGQVDMLGHVESVEFLRRLPAALPLNELASDDMDNELLDVAWLSAPLLEDRQIWIDALAPDKKAKLAAQARRFRALPPPERDRLRDLQREIEAADDTDELQRNLLVYGHWLGRMTPGEQEELKESLRGQPVEAQIGRLQRLVRRENTHTSRKLSRDEEENLRRAVMEFVEERRSTLLSEMQRRDRGERVRRLEGPRGALLILTWTMRNESAASAAYDRLAGAVTPEHRAQLERLNHRARWFQLWQWVRDAMQPEWSPGELERFFAADLDNQQRERLLNLPPAEMQSELEKLYLANELGFRGMAIPGGGPWGPPGGPDRPDFRLDPRGRPGGPPPEFPNRRRFDPRRGPPPGNDFREHQPGGPGIPPPRPEQRNAI